MNRMASFGFSARWRRQLLQRLPPHLDPVRTLDLFAGPGETWRHIKAAYPRTEITAVDFSPGMVVQARRNNTLHFNDEVTILEADVLNAELPSGHFDLVVCAFGLKSLHPTEVAKLARIMERILAPGGYFVFMEISIPPARPVKWLFRFYTKYLVPALGSLFGRGAEFRMLWKYTSAYGNSESAARSFESVGLNVEQDSYFFGCATGFHGRKKPIVVSAAGTVQE